MMSCAKESGAFYTELAKNTVSAKEQLKESEVVKFHFPEHNGIRIMFVGNSITFHDPVAKIGWLNACGMAASAEENDYVHILERAVLQEYPDASFCICQVSSWESQYKEGSKVHSLYSAAQAFEADVIIMRCVENCPVADLDLVRFEEELYSLIYYLDQKKKAKIIITTGFWHNPFDDVLREYARVHDCPCIELGDLGGNDAAKAVGLFEHTGVANHPGDLGMKYIAERIATPLMPLVEYIVNSEKDNNK